MSLSSDQPRVQSAVPEAVPGGAAEFAGRRNLTIGDLLREAAAQSGDQLALVDAIADPAQRRRWTYAQVLAQSEQVAKALLRQFQPGDRIAIASPNCPEWVILQFGTLFAGMVLIPINPAYREAEIATILTDCEASALFHADTWRSNDLAASAAAIRATLPGLFTASLSGWDSFLASGDSGTILPEVQPRDPALIQFTSGTTGRPKGAILHHGMIGPASIVVERCGFRQHGKWLNCMPLYHIAGSCSSLLGALAKHGAFVLMREWDPALALDVIEQERCNAMLLVPTMIVTMLDCPGSSDHDLSSVDYILTGAAPVPPALLDKVKERIGCPLLISFGMTESGGVVSSTTLADGAYELANTLGRALPGVQIEIRDPETGALCPLGSVGEMWYRGDQIMLGYYGRDDETAAAITPDGWLRSGDLGTMDERGYLSISGRLKDMIIRGGANIYPREIEHVLFDHPAVAQAAVCGIPDPKWGETVLAVIQQVPGQDLRFEELDKYCRERLASFKVPERWVCIETWPMNATGKIQKFVLVDMVREGELSPVTLR